MEEKVLRGPWVIVSARALPTDLNCPPARGTVKSASRTPQVSESLPEKIAMRGIVEPSRCATRMRERDERHSVLHADSPDRALERDFSPEPLDRETTDEEDDARLQQRELLLQPRCTERDLGRRRSTIAASARRLSREALRDRRAVGKMVFVDPRFGQPAPQLRAGAATERLTGGELDLAWCLADDRDPIADGAGDNRLRALEVTGGDALRAGPNTCVKTCERTCTIDRGYAAC